MDGDTFFFIAIAVFIVVCYIQRQTYKGLLKMKEKKFEKEISILRNKFLHEKYELNKLVDDMQKKSETYVSLHHDIMKSKRPFNRVAELFCDWNTAVYDDTITFLRTKKKSSC